MGVGGSTSSMRRPAPTRGSAAGRSRRAGGGAAGRRGGGRAGGRGEGDGPAGAGGRVEVAQVVGAPGGGQVGDRCAPGAWGGLGAVGAEVAQGPVAETAAGHGPELLLYRL